MDKSQHATGEVLNTFQEIYQLDVRTRALHLIEETVELATSVSKKEGSFPIELKEGELEEGFGGVLFDLFALANSLNVDLKKIYPKELEKFKIYSK
ncbi:MAG: hypothetical protein HRT72_00140 [Flavobacteriales bacterium]|nr:hypothetical protein [Flavobacteriales bacterium]